MTTQKFRLTILGLALAAGAAPGGCPSSAAAPVALAVDSIRDRIYVVHRAAFRGAQVNADLPPTDVVSVLDHSGNIVAAIKIGKAANGAGQGIAVDSARNRVFVSNAGAGEGTVSIIDGAANTVVGAVEIGGEPLGVAADPELGLVYVTNAQSRSLSILNAITGRIAGTVVLGGGAYSVAVDPRTHLAWVSVHASSWAIAAVDARGSICARVELPSLESLGELAIDPGSRLYVSDRNSGLVAVVDIASGTPRELTRFPAGSYPGAAAVDAATGLVYIADTGSDRVNVFDGNGNRLSSIEVRRLPAATPVDESAGRADVTVTRPRLDDVRALAIDPLRRRLYLTAPSEFSGLQVLDLETGAALPVR